MRVIAGLARGYTLKPPRNLMTRPTSDKVRGAIFDILDVLGAVAGARVLDLYAGSGALGIEALSRGASACDFVEMDHHALAAIRDNLAHTHLAPLAHVYAMSVERFLTTMTGTYQLVLLDPPYTTAVASVLERLGQPGLVDEEAIVVVEQSKRATLAETYGRLQLLKSRRYGDTSITFYSTGRSDSEASGQTQ